jgi:nicotinate-nucleotide pyrophosphorylase (carboxylating)
MTKININTDFSLNVLRDVVKKNVKAALEEDIGEGDITASLISEQNNSHATVIVREEAVLAGSPWFQKVFETLDQKIEVQWHYQDGDRIKENDIICELQGSTQAILTGERTALNFLQTLSGTATKTRAFVNALGCSNTKILDTRKTLPGLRLAQKYAVLCGGGNNHRIGLYDAILIKENHILACGSILKAVIKAKYDNPSMRVEVEVENLEELQQAVDAKAHMVLLDNFSLEKVKKAIKIVNNSLVIELSGGMDLDKVIMLKDLGADFISIGALTKDLHATDFSMRLS